MCRIPTSIHEVSGEECYLVERIEKDKITPAKFRGIDHFKLRGLKSENWVRCVGLASDAIKNRELIALKEQESLEKEQAERKENGEPEYEFVGKIRPCFQRRMESGEMGHQMRLALELEAYWAGHKTRESIMELFKSFHDFDEKVTREQVEWFFKNKVPDIEKSKKWKPYRCLTLEELNLCDKLRCPMFIKRKERGK
jgi:hypothetical protein